MKPLALKILKPLMGLALLSSSACVSVSLKKEPVVRSDKYTYQNPSGNFKRIDPDNADHAWRNSKTGNTIAIISECSQNKDPELASLESESMEALSAAKVLSSKTVTYNDREALRSVGEGNIDGVPVKIDVLNFKKSTCMYALTYFGKSSGFSSDQTEFENFIKGFKAQ